MRSETVEDAEPYEARSLREPGVCSLHPRLPENWSRSEQQLHRESLLSAEYGMFKRTVIASAITVPSAKSRVCNRVQTMNDMLILQAPPFNQFIVTVYRKLNHAQTFG
jgi:hypothetical protein